LRGRGGTAPTRSTAPIGAARHRSALLLFALTAFYAGLSAAVTYPQIRFLNRAIPNLVDGYFNIWRLAWIAHQLPRHPLDLFNANIFYPERHTLAFSDALLAPAVLAAPFFWLKGNPVLIYNVVLLAAFALSGLATFALVQQLTHNRTAALVAGAFFVCAPYRFDHYVHLEMQLTMFMPVALWALHRTIRTRRWPSALMVAVALAMQVFSSIYYGIFFSTIFFVIAGLLVVAEARANIPRAALLLAAAALVTVVLVLPYMVPYLEARGTVGEREESAVLYYSAMPRDYLASRPDNWLYGGRLNQSNSEERHLFPGAALLLLAAVALWPPASPMAAVYLIAAALAFEASLGLHGFLFGWLREWLLPYQGIRVPARFGMLVAFLLAVLAGFGMARVTRPLGGLARAVLTVITLTAMLIEARTPVVLTTLATKPAVVDTWLRDQPRSVIVELPVPPPNQPFQESEGQPLYHSIFHWQPLLNGTSGFFPASYLDLLAHMQPFPDADSVRYLQTRGVRYVVMRQYLLEPAEFTRLQDRLGHQPGVTFVGRFPEPVGESLVYEVSRKTTDSFTRISRR
jgi:hypothetical protein